MSTDASSSCLRVAAVQMAPLLGDIPYNLSRIISWMMCAADAKAKLIVFPECALTGYVFESREEALPCAEHLPGLSTDMIAIECDELGVHVVLGLLERSGDQLFNACALIGPTGLLASYRKVHLPWMGVDRFTDKGEQPFAVHEVFGVRIGMHICYDGTFPEVGRVLALGGADLLILPTNFGVGAEPVAEHMMAARAIENTVYAMAVNRVGTERGSRFIGRSGIYDPMGRPLALASADAEEMLMAEIDPSRARDKQIVREPGRAHCNRIADRRPDFYKALLEPVAPANIRA